MFSCMEEFAPLDGEIDFTPDKQFSEILTVKGGNFGYVPMNKLVVKKVILKNNIDATLTISKITYPDGFEGPSVIDKEVLGKDSLVIEVSFKPTQKKVYNSRITVENNFNSVLKLPIIGSSDSDRGFFTDNRDMHVYAWVRIGDQIWMAENLAYLPILGPSKISVDGRFIWSDYEKFGFNVKDYMGTDMSEAKKTTQYKRFGVFYRSDQANEVCPEGWHLPSNEEWNKMAVYVKNNNSGYNAKAIASQNLWENSDYEKSVGYNQASNNSTGFNGRPSGEMYIKFDYPSSWCLEPSLGCLASWWASMGRYWYIDSGSSVIDSYEEYNDATSKKLLPIRCIKDDGLKDYASGIEITTDVDFSYVGLSKTVEKEIIITNNNLYPISVMEVEYPVGFSGSIEGEIPAGAQKSFKLCLTPTEKKEYSDEIIRIHMDVGDILNIVCNGTSVYDEANSLILTNNLDFAYVEPGSTKAQTLTVSNSCNFDIEITEIVCPEGFSSETIAISISKGESKDIEISFTPSEEKVYDSEIKLKTDIGEDLIVSVLAKSSGKAKLGSLTISDIKPVSVNVTGNVTDEGDSEVTMRGFVWSTAQNPTLETNEGKTEEGTGLGEFTSTISDLKYGTTYYVRSYAINLQGTAYGVEKSFTTNDYTLPEVLTNEVTEVRSTSAICGGNIISDGYKSVTLHGVVWSTVQSPSLENNEGKTADGSGQGEYISVLSGLKEETTYYVRSYATNSEGTAYGAEKSFTTKFLEDIPEFVKIEGGHFQMGSNDGNSDEKPIHRVSVDDFYIGKYEITQAQWKTVMGSNPSNLIGDNLPVERVSWNDIQTFITKLNEQTGRTYRLPTEAEWEFAARGGNLSKGYKYSGSNILDDIAWCNGNSGGKTHVVDTKQPNELGIYGMSGNVWELCNDRYSSTYYSSSPADNPVGPASGSDHVLRGGSIGLSAKYCRVSSRLSAQPDGRYKNCGFRLVQVQ